MEIHQKTIDSLIFAEYNPRQLTDEQYKQLKDSITRFGLVDPVIVNQHKDRLNIIVGGHQRVKVAKKMGIEDVPCVFVNLNYDKERELNVRLNKNTGGWDFDILADMFDMDELIGWGFSNEDLKLFDDGYGDDFILPDGDKPPFKQMTFTLSDEQAEVVDAAIKKAKKNDFSDSGNENSNGNAIWWICNSYDKS